MYRLTMFITFIMMMSITAFAENEPNRIYVSGQVLHVIYGGPVSDQPVHIFMPGTGINRSNDYYKEVYTNEEGYYFDTIQTREISGTVIMSTFDKEGVAFENTMHFRFNDNILSDVVLGNFYIDVPYQFKPLQARFKYVQKSERDRYRFWFFDETTAENIVDRQWNFGDGTTSNLKDPEHIYSQSGLFKVSLTVTIQIYSQYFSNTITQLIYISPFEFYHFGGHVFTEYMPIDKGFAFLYVLDTLQHYHPLDTAIIDTLGYYYFYQVPVGNYIVKSSLHDQSEFFGQYAPTYFGDEIYWQNTTPFLLQHTSWEYDIHLYPLQSYIPGNGHIEGQIVYNNSPKASDIVFPACGVNIYLMDNNEILIMSARTDEEGNFSFDHMLPVTYWIYPEITGITAEKIKVDLSSDIPVADGIHITIVEDMAIGIHNAEADQLSEADVYPLPANSIIAIKFHQKLDKLLFIDIMDIYGNILLEEVSEQNSQSKVLSIDKLKSGWYILNIRNEKGEIQTRKKIVVIK